MKKIVISGAMILAASTAYAAVSPTSLIKTITSKVTVIAAPAIVKINGKTPVTLTVGTTGKAIEPVPGAVQTGLLPGQGQLDKIASNFDVNKFLVPSWGTGEIAQTGRPDVVGAFRFLCSAGDVKRDDPIVFPGQPGKSHLHQFFGNTGANAYSTYATLRTTGESTCGNILNRSAYWIPAMLDGVGKVVRPDYVVIYYKRLPEDSPQCKTMGKACVALPRGMRYIFGYNMATDKAEHFYFNCDGPTATSGAYPDLVTAAKNCPAGNRIGAVVAGPQCWDGKNLNSADHRSHVGYPDFNDRGQLLCPANLPYVIPTFSLGAWYTVDDNLDRSGEWKPGTQTWSLSSDNMPGMPAKRPGSTFHADWMGAWDDATMKAWIDNCINKLLTCNGGDLGNGKQLRADPNFDWTAHPRLVDVPTA
ncbi:DUF1996 domain-containing protein [Sphingomonas sp. 8AM]|uniref:DUF1996 domain-containing protein n=1 Tax=Sphingomonas sp. 8AM TaxID=2653170 RepID=UPI0012F1853C|nr:DUF1996 domain-containing protein [Sphingomonas sp. 8AM]VXC87914.1 conserved exported hypothetical protein [Sphingomonas sp. 8AM]